MKLLIMMSIYLSNSMFPKQTKMMKKTQRKPKKLSKLIKNQPKIQLKKGKKHFSKFTKNRTKFVLKIVF
jgi:hypothetical protein